jgi:hypothetical protein
MCLQKIDSAAMQDVLYNELWPTSFDHYESLLRLGLEAGKSFRFFYPLNSSLTWTIADLAKDRPGIGLSEIAELLNLEPGLAAQLAQKAVQENGVQITFDRSE